MNPVCVGYVGPPHLDRYTREARAHIYVCNGDTLHSLHTRK